MSTQLLAERYELRETLGSGGMARVFEGYDRVLDRRVAVKLLREDTGGPQSQERFLREARAAASFHHPNAVAVFDTGRDDGTPFIVMELVEGPTLADELAERGRLDPHRSLDIAEQVLAALAEAHRRGLVHRDVKPANIMLPHNGEAKLTDFGIAKSVRDTAAGLTLAGQVFGTPKYLSPEQVNGQQATPRSDVYALGVVLYEMLAGEPPFTGDNAIAIAIAHTEDEPRRLDRVRDDVDPAVVAFVHRALEKDPLARFADAAEMRGALRQARAGVAPGLAPTQRLGDRTVPLRDRTRPLGAGAGAASVLEREAEAGAPPKRRRGGHLWLWITVAALLLLGVVLGGAWVADRLGEVTDPTEEPVEEEPAEPEEPEDAPEDPADDPAEEAPDDPPADDPPADDPPADDAEPPADDPADEAPPEDAPAEEPEPPADAPGPQEDAPGQSREAPGQSDEPPPGQSDEPPAAPSAGDTGTDTAQPSRPAEPASSVEDAAADEVPVGGSTG